MYTLKEQSGEEVLFFAPEEVNEQIKTLKKGDRFEITKLAEQKGTKIVTRYDIKVERKNLESPANELNKSNGGDYFYDLMLASCRDAVKIQNELGGLMDAKSLHQNTQALRLHQKKVARWNEFSQHISDRCCESR